MKVTITHKDEKRVLDIDDMSMRDALDCERLTGTTFVEWRNNLARESAKAVTFAWWLAGQRDDKDEMFNHLLDQLNYGALQFEVVDDEPEPVEEVESQDPTGPDQGPQQ